MDIRKGVDPVMVRDIIDGLREENNESQMSETSRLARNSQERIQETRDHFIRVKVLPVHD